MRPFLEESLAGIDGAMRFWWLEIGWREWADFVLSGGEGIGGAGDRCVADGALEMARENAAEAADSTCGLILRTSADVLSRVAIGTIRSNHRWLFYLFLCWTSIGAVHSRLFIDCSNPAGFF